MEHDEQESMVLMGPHFVVWSAGPVVSHISEINPQELAEEDLQVVGEAQESVYV